jgi:Tfp pilus assembly protein PilN
MPTDLRIDFLARHRWPNTGVVLALAALAGAAWQGAQAFRESEALRLQGGRAAALQAQRATPRLPALSAAARTRLQQIDKVTNYLATPWGTMLASFESHASPQVRLLRFEPNAAEGRVNVRGRARGIKPLSAYLQALEKDPRLYAVMLSHHERVQDDDSGDIEFTLAAGWTAPSAVAAAPLRAAR